MRLSVITAQLLRDGEKNVEIPKTLCALPPPYSPLPHPQPIGRSLAVFANSCLKCLFVLVLTHKRVNSSIMVRDVGIKVC